MREKKILISADPSVDQPPDYGTKRHTDHPVRQDTKWVACRAVRIGM
jgi:hypothetical protein